MRIDDVALALLVGEGNLEKNSLNFLPIQSDGNSELKLS